MTRLPLRDSLMRDAEAHGALALGDLPEWDLTDLYPSPDAPELSRDLERLDAPRARQHVGLAVDARRQRMDPDIVGRQQLLQVRPAPPQVEEAARQAAMCGMEVSGVLERFEGGGRGRRLCMPQMCCRDVV